MAAQNPLQQFLDPQSLVQGFQTLLRTVEWAAEQARGGNGNFLGDSYEREGNGNGSHYRTPEDEFESYDEESLDDGRVVRRYDDGTVRIENTVSGVMQEEPPDGSLTISLPGGKLIYQQYRGEPLLVYDSSGENPPHVAQVSSVTMPGMEPAIMFHFQDAQGTHLIELETLRYYRLSRSF